MADNPIKLRKYGDIFGSPSGDIKSNTIEVVELPISHLHPFNGYRFKLYDKEKETEMMNSIRHNGVIVPIIVRKIDENKYEIIAGHNRVHCSKLLGLESINGIIKDIDDDTAILNMVDTNLQREVLLPSEKAWGYKLKLEVMNRQGKRTDLTYSQVGNKLNGKLSVELLSDEIGESKNQIFRYIRLTNLIPKLLEMVDIKSIPLIPAVELSYLTVEEQTLCLEFMEKAKVIPSLLQAQQLKKYSQENKLTADIIDVILSEKKPEIKKVTLSEDKIKKYFPVSFSVKEIEDLILELLENWSNSKMEK